VGDRVRVRGKVGLIMRIKFTQNSNFFSYEYFGKFAFFLNFLVGIIKSKQRQIYRVAFLHIDAEHLIEDYEHHEIEIWTKQAEREEKLKKLGI
jgi:hypothetical protein